MTLMFQFVGIGNGNAAKQNCFAVGNNKMIPLNANQRKLIGRVAAIRTAKRTDIPPLMIIVRLNAGLRARVLQKKQGAENGKKSKGNFHIQVHIRNYALMASFRIDYKLTTLFFMAPLQMPFHFPAAPKFINLAPCSSQPTCLTSRKPNTPRFLPIATLRGTPSKKLKVISRNSRDKIRPNDFPAQASARKFSSAKARWSNPAR